jgi:hypothetical protein
MKPPNLNFSPTLRETLTTRVEEVGDVLVVGAGSAGIAAALAAARSGAKTMLVDPAGFPGGTLVSGLAILGCHDGEKQVVRGLFQEIVERLQARDGVEGDPAHTTAINVDVEKLKILLLEMLHEAGVDLRLHTFFSRAETDRQKISAAVVEGKGGRTALIAKQFIDATGDADLALSAGVPVEKGRKQDGKVQPMTMMFAVGNIDKAAFAAWGGYPALEKLYCEIATRDAFRNPRRADLSCIWGPSSRTGEFAFNVTRVLESDGSDSRSLSRAELEGRLQVWEFMEKFLKPHVPGFARSYIVWTAAKIGVRETRRIVGEYVITRDDIWNYVKFPDAINCGSYPIDIHSPTDSTTEFPMDHFYGGKYWTIPYRALVPLNVENLLVAGRCLSATHEAMAAVRCMANTIGMGEAAGFAAALCVRSGATPRTLDYREVQRALRQNGGWLGEVAVS